MAVAPERQPMPLVGEPLVEHAVWYGKNLGPVFPVRRDTKQPYTKHGFKDASTDEATIRAWWAKHPTANIGFALPAGWLVIDVDARNDGVLTLNELEATYTALPRTLTSLTGSGGGSAHYCFTAPPDADLRGKLGQGLDIRLGEKHYIILPPSIHASGQRYMWESDYGPDDIAPQTAPAWVMALLAQPSTNGTGGGYAAEDNGGPIYEGEREARLMSIGGKLLHDGKTPAEVFDAMDTANSTRCIPALSARDVKRLADNLYKYDTEHKAAQPQFMVTTKAIPLGFSARAADQGAANDPMPPSPTEWMKDLFIYAKSGELKQNAFNIGQILRNHPFWHMPERQLWYDVIRGYHMCGMEQISKSLCTRATQWFGGQMRLAISNIELLKLCMEAEAAENHIDLLEQHLLGLHTWDRKPRLETWLHEVTGAEDNPYTRHLSRALPVSMVARVLAPGCPCRLVVILEGKENIGKSHLVEALATSEWYTILSMSLEGKDSHIMLHKYWIAELAELDSLSRTEEARMKAFVTMETDTYVPKYSNVAVSIPRRTIFMGTTNDGSGYLKGQSGNTRYYPLKVGERIDVDRFRTMRAQVFAEAMVWHSEHFDTWWHEPAEVTAMANEARELRRQASDYEQPLHEWLAYTRHDTVTYEDGTPVTFTRNETSWPEIARWFLKIDAPERWKDRSLQIQIASALKALGWISSPVWRFGRTTRIWTLPEPGSEG